MPNDEKELIKKCKQGDISCFGQLYQLYKRRAYSIALGMLGKEDEALDAIQDAFIKTFRNIKRHDSSKSFSSWFFSILINHCRDLLRQRKRRRREISIDNANLYNRLGVYNGRYSPELLLERKELTIRLWQVIGQLEVKHRQIIILRDFQDMKYKKIAEILHIPLGTVMSRLHQARKSLKKLMKKYIQ
jgi:RNA polymerase sigma-70 factor (ECF subfamily)